MCMPLLAVPRHAQVPQCPQWTLSSVVLVFVCCVVVPNICHCVEKSAFVASTTQTVFYLMCIKHMHIYTLTPRITRTVHTVETESTPVEKSAFVASDHSTLPLRLCSDHILCHEWLSTANNNFAIIVMHAACSSGMLTNCSMPAMPINRCLLPIPIPA
jgi:hypothetical protein